MGARIAVLRVNGKWTAFIKRFYPKHFTIVADIHPFVHTFTHRRWSQTVQGNGPARQEPSGLGSWLGGAGDQTSNLVVTGQPRLTSWATAAQAGGSD